MLVIIDSVWTLFLMSLHPLICTNFLQSTLELFYKGVCSDGSQPSVTWSSKTGISFLGIIHYPISTMMYNSRNSL